MAAAIIVRKPEAVVVDLSPLPSDHSIVLPALRDVIAALHGEAIPCLVWVMPPKLLAFYVDGDDDAFSDLWEEIGVTSYGRQTSMVFVSPPNVGIRMMLQQYGIEPVSPQE